MGAAEISKDNVSDLICDVCFNIIPNSGQNTRWIVGDRDVIFEHALELMVKDEISPTDENRCFIFPSAVATYLVRKGKKFEI